MAKSWCGSTTRRVRGITRQQADVVAAAFEPLDRDLASTRATTTWPLGRRWCGARRPGRRRNAVVEHRIALHLQQVLRREREPPAVQPQLLIESDVGAIAHPPPPVQHRQGNQSIATRVRRPADAALLPRSQFDQAVGHQSPNVLCAALRRRSRIQPRSRPGWAPFPVLRSVTEEGHTAARLGGRVSTGVHLYTFIALSEIDGSMAGSQRSGMNTLLVCCARSVRRESIRWTWTIQPASALLLFLRTYSTCDCSSSFVAGPLGDLALQAFDLALSNSMICRCRHRPCDGGGRGRVRTPTARLRPELEHQAAAST